jgi:alpha-glucosidase
VPLPWSGTTPPYDFSIGGASATPWLPQPSDWARLTVEAQANDRDSMLQLYRNALAIRRAHPGLGDGTLTWIDSEPDVLAFDRGHGFVCVTNLSEASVELPAHHELLLSSAPLENGLLPTDSTAWLRTQH